MLRAFLPLSPQILTTAGCADAETEEGDDRPEGRGVETECVP